MILLVLLQALGVVYSSKGAAAASGQQLVPLIIHLPHPDSGNALFSLELDPAHVETLSNRPRPPLMVPAGTTNLAVGCRVTSSDPQASRQALQKLVDGSTHKKNCRTDFMVLSPGPQWVQVDLGAEYSLYAVVVWHSFRVGPWIFHGVVVQTATDGEFNENVRTLFNNDYKNLIGVGAGQDKEYFETPEGKLVATNGQVARYLRFYSAGSTCSPENHYFALEVYGLPRHARPY